MRGARIRLIGINEGLLLLVVSQLTLHNFLFKSDISFGLFVVSKSCVFSVWDNPGGDVVDVAEPVLGPVPASFSRLQPLLRHRHRFARQLHRPPKPFRTFLPNIKPVFKQIKIHFLQNQGVVDQFFVVVWIKSG